MESDTGGIKKSKIVCAHQRLQEGGTDEDSDTGQRVKTKLGKNKLLRNNVQYGN